MKDIIIWSGFLAIACMAVEYFNRKYFKISKSPEMDYVPVFGIVGFLSAFIGLCTLSFATMRLIWRSL